MTRSGQAAGLLSDNVAAARPPVDAAAMEDARARAERALFGRAEPPRLGRFVLLRPIAGGGMGLIHRAYDPQLERPVALKLLHPRQHGTPHARARLIAEARVLAKLAHPNVVPVYDVVEIEDQVVIVMELIEGGTLAEWERARPRRWREVVAVYAQAGRGLAAAHELGIVHRDFKPANAIAGDDGRVRVLDFGLARSSDAPGDAPADAPADAPGDAPADVSVDALGDVPVDTGAGARVDPAAGGGRLSLTASGEVLGTLAYMAPEQLAGAPATAASDQFSFCVSLHRALYGAPPFSGDDAASRRASILAGRLAAPPGARVPGGVRAAIARGLAAAPEARHASMAALLGELERERGWRRWRWPAAASAVALAVALAVVSAARGGAGGAADPLAICEGAAGEAAPVWSADRARQVRAALAGVGTAYAGAIADRVPAALDAYRDRWVTARREACRAYRSVRLSDERFDRRSACLDRRLQDLAGAAGVLGELDAASAAHAVDVAARLPPIEPCAALDALPDEGGAPAGRESPEVRAALAALRAQLARADALERAGRSAEAAALADRALAAARGTSDPHAVLEAALAKGRILMLRYDFAGAIAPLAEAEQLALEHRRLGAAVIAGARRVYAESMRGMALDRLAGQVALLEPLSRGLRGERTARPLLLNYVGVVYMTRGERAEAHRHFAAAHRALGGAAPDLELTAIDMNLAMLTEDAATREALAARAWGQLREALGPQHPTVLAEQCRYAHYVSDPARAHELLREAGALLGRFHPDRARERSICAASEAALAGELGRPGEEIAARYDEVVALARGATDDDTRMRARLAEGHAHLHRTDPAAALAPFTAVLEQLGRSDRWWEQLLVAEAHLGAGLAEEALAAVGGAGAGPRLSRAAAHFERAIEGFVSASARNADQEPRRRLALARASLARVRRR